MKPFEILSRKIVLDSLYMPIEQQRVRLPNGEEADWFVSLASDAVVVLPITKDGSFLLQRAYKHGCESVVVEFCIGMVEKGELVDLTAMRELQEETGYKASRVEKIGELFVNPTGSQQRYHFFIAYDCEEAGDQKLDNAEQIEVIRCKNLQEVESLLFASDTKTSCVNMAGLVYLKQKHS